MVCGSKDEQQLFQLQPTYRLVNVCTLISPPQTLPRYRVYLVLVYGSSITPECSTLLPYGLTAAVVDYLIINR